MNHLKLDSKPNDKTSESLFLKKQVSIQHHIEDTSQLNDMTKRNKIATEKK